jgi:hypothetical protein
MPCCSHCPVQVINETLPALRSLKAQGLLGAVGFSALPLPVFRHILDRTLPGRYELDTAALSMCLFATCVRFMRVAAEVFEGGCHWTCFLAVRGMRCACS